MEGCDNDGFFFITGTLGVYWPLSKGRAYDLETHSNSEIGGKNASEYGNDMCLS